MSTISLGLLLTLAMDLNAVADILDADQVIVMLPEGPGKKMALSGSFRGRELMRGPRDRTY